MYTEKEILEEVARIQYLYEMKRVIRYHHTREEEFDTESVAEHVYGMLILALYFLPLEDPDSELDQQKVMQMALWHDIDEIETGDKISYLKDAADRKLGEVARKQVLENIPEGVRSSAEKLIQEYEGQTTREAQFVKALDRIEPLFHLFSEEGKRILHALGTTLEQNSSIKEPFVRPFPVMYQFYKTMTAEMLHRGFFTDSNQQTV